MEDGKVTQKALKKGEKGFLLLDKTCFYPEGGGPIGDIGEIKTKNGKAKVFDCQKEGEFLIHEILVEKGELKEEDCEMKVNAIFREEVSKSHTATHLLNASLREVLGEGVRQAGSLVEPGRLRFDFTHKKALTKKELESIEEKVINRIKEGASLSSSYLSLEEAKKEGALFLAGEAYSEKVRVIRAGSSFEFCGGIHVKNTKDIENFQIVYEKGVQAGVRRIMAYTGRLARIFEDALVDQSLKLRKKLDLEKPSSLKRNKDGFFEGSFEKENPFLKVLEGKKKLVKKIKQNLVHLDFKKSYEEEKVKIEKEKLKKTSNPLVIQNLEFREELQIPFPKEKSFSLVKESFLEKKKFSFSDFFDEEEDPFKEAVEGKKKEEEELKSQLTKLKKEGLSKDKLLSSSKDFKESKLLIHFLPIKDRKVLSDMSDGLIHALSSGVLVLVGEDKASHPVIVQVTKDLQKTLPAGQVFKKYIVPVCEGRGGGKPSFAQGSLENKSKLKELEKTLLKDLKG